MRTELDEMIDRFRSLQDRAVTTLVDTLGLPLPISNVAWAFFCREQRLHGVKQLSGIPFRPHGYGVQLEIDGVKIDFDWGDDGQPDGFDGWRLWWHYSSNGWDAPGTHADVNDWLATANADGELEKQRSLYYDPKRRSTIPWVRDTAEQ